MERGFGKGVKVSVEWVSDGRVRGGVGLRCVFIEFSFLFWFCFLVLGFWGFFFVCFFSNFGFRYFWLFFEFGISREIGRCRSGVDMIFVLLLEKF